MQVNQKKAFKFLVVTNIFISFCITWNIFIVNNYNILKLELKTSVILLYACLWFFSLYKLYNLSKFGRLIYLYLIFVGYIFNILSNPGELGKIYYILSLFEHMIIGSILTFAYFSKIYDTTKEGNAFTVESIILPVVRFEQYSILAL